MLSVQHDELERAVREVLDSEIRPVLHFHGGDVRLVDIEPEGVVRLEYVGACRGCQMQVATHFVTVRQRLLRIPGITDATVPGIRLSECAIRRIETLYESKSP